MSLHFKRILMALCLGLLGHAAQAAGLMIYSVAPDVTELDLFDAKAGGAYAKTIDPATLRYPIPILEDLNGSYIIRIDGKRYAVDAAIVNTNKTFHAKAKGECVSMLDGDRQASGRGITGQGC